MGDFIKIELEWNKPINKIVDQVTGGEAGQLFLANEAKRLMDPYVPADELILAQNVQVYTEKGKGIVHYKSPYAHYQWEGILYVSSITGSAWSKGEYKVATSKKLKHAQFRHPLASSHWEKAMMTARKNDLAKAMENHLKGQKS